VSTIGPVAVGVAVAFAWNTAATHQTAGSGTAAGVSPEVGLTVEQAAEHAWASATPRASKPRVSVRPAGHGCGWQRTHPITVLWSSRAQRLLPGCPRDTGRPQDTGPDR
jgi:hypothetical protein